MSTLKKLYLKMAKIQPTVFNLRDFFRAVLMAIAAVLAILFFASFVPRAFSGAEIINPVFFTLGKIVIRWYGIILAVAVLTAYFISQKKLIKNGVSQSNSENILILTIIFGVIGTRVGFVIQNLNYFSKHIIEIIEIWQGGLSIQGGLIAGVISLIFLARHYKISFYVLADSIAPQALLGGAIGRFGNFFNEEIIGRPAPDSLPWKMYVSLINRPDGYFQNNFFHPVFLYESLLLALAYMVFVLFEKRFGSKYGLAYTLVLYSLSRIIVEFWRIDYKPIISRLDLAQIVGFAILVAGVVLCLGQRRQNAKGTRTV